MDCTVAEKKQKQTSSTENYTLSTENYTSQKSLRPHQPICDATAHHVTQSKFLLWREGTHRRSGRKIYTLRVSSDHIREGDSPSPCNVLFWRVYRALGVRNRRGLVRGKCVSVGLYFLVQVPGMAKLEKLGSWNVRIRRKLDGLVSTACEGKRGVEGCKPC